MIFIYEKYIMEFNRWDIIYNNGYDNLTSINIILWKQTYDDNMYITQIIHVVRSKSWNLWRRDCFWKAWKIFDNLPWWNIHKDYITLIWKHI